MRKILFTLLTLVAFTTAAIAEEEYHVVYSTDIFNTISAEQRLHDQIVTSMEESHKQKDMETLLDESMMPTMTAMRNIEAIKEAAKHSAAEDKYGVYTPIRELEYTAVPLIAFGFIAKGNKKNFRAARNNFIPSYKNRIDDQLQLTPMVITAGLHFAGYKGRSKTQRFIVSNLMSYGFMTLFVNSVKYSAKEMRPDGSTANSFPSGHTATAFTAATILHKEYGLTCSPWWSILGYGCATTTGIMRTLNNRHWISDVLVGAGIGVISTDLGYMMSDLIYKKKGINREPRANATNLIDNPSFFRLELGMQTNSDLKLPTHTSFLTMDNLYTHTGAASYDDDFYTIQRNGNPFRIPDSYNDKDNIEYTNYTSGKPAYDEGVTPVIKVAMGTTVGAEAAYFLNKYIGVGARARITTAPVTAEGLYCYRENNQKVDNSSSVSDVWSLVDIGAGIYLSWPISPRHNVGGKVLYGRRFFGKMDFTAAYDENYQNKKTGEVINTTMYGDNLTIDKTDSDNFTLGMHYTYAMNSGIAISAFVDYDYSKPEFDVKYNPYNRELRKMVQTCSEFSFKNKINSWTFGASMTVLF